MNKLEKETLILINRGDLDDGFFCFETTEASHFRKLCKRIGGKNELQEVKHSETSDRKSQWWQYKVPAKYLSLSTFGIKSAGRIQAALKRDNFPKKNESVSIENDDNSPCMKNDTIADTTRKKTPAL